MVEKEIGARFGSFSIKHNRNTAIICLAVTLAFAASILIWGIFYSNSQVPWPKDQVSIFPEDAYKEASRYFPPATAFTYISRDTISGEALALFTGEIPASPFETLLEILNQKYRGKAIIVDCSLGGLSDTALETTLSRLSTDLNTEISERETAADQLAFWDRGEALEQITAKKRVLRRLEDFRSFMKEVRLSFNIEYPHGGTAIGFSFVATDNLGEIRADSEGRLISFYAQNSRPAYEMSFLRREGVPDRDILKEKLSADKERLKNMYAKARADYKVEIDKIREKLSNQRAQVRENFYKKWFAVLIRTLVTYFMVLLLIKFFKIIRRKGLPRKSTFEAYFATNMTSVLLRWIALGVVILGIANLIIILLQSMISAGVSLNISFIRRLLPSFFFSFGYISAVIAPVSQALITVITAWGFILGSEFICFLSNCYHVQFERAYKTDKVENLKYD